MVFFPQGELSLIHRCQRVTLSKTARRPKSDLETNVTVDTKNDLPVLSKSGRQAGRSKSKY